jgi:uncharacterized protein YjdB
MRSTVLQAMFALLLVSENGCSNPGQPRSPDQSPNMVSVQGVRVTPQSINFATIGETRQLSAVVAPANATDQAIIWESTDPTVATVDAIGVVTAKAAGSGIIITAYTHDGGYQASVNVSVEP